MAIDTKNNIISNSAYSSVRPYTPHPRASLALATPVIAPKKRDVAFLYTPEFNKAVSDRCRALFKMNMKEKFSSGTLPLADFYKKVEGITKLSAYIESDPILKDLGVEYNNLLSNFKYACRHNIPVDFNFESRRDSLESLRNFGADKENKLISKKIGKNLLEDIIIYNEDKVSDFDKEAVKNVRHLLKSKSLAPIRKNLKDTYILTLLKKHEACKNIGENIRVLENILKNPDYSFLKNNKSFNLSLLLYGGNLQKYMETVKEANSHLSQGEKLKFLYNPSTNDVLIKMHSESHGGLKLNRSVRYDKNFKVISEEKVVEGISSTGKKTMNILVDDYQRNSEYRLRYVYDKNHKSWILTNNTEKIKDAAGKVKLIKVMQMSDVSGVYNIKSIDSSGKIKTISSSVKKADGTHIEKNLTSPSGDTTFYRFFKSNDNKTEKFSFEIKNKDGKLLAKKESLFKRLSSKLAMSEVNGERYKIEYLENEINVINEKTKQITVLNLKKLLPHGDKRVFSLLKKLSAPELLAVKENIKVLDTIKANESYFMIGANEIASSLNRFIFEHELGHAKDSLVEQLSDVINDSRKTINHAETKVVSDKKLQKIFLAERKKFLQAMPVKLRQTASYFISENIERPFIKGLSEAAAEINAILNAPSAPKWVMGRAHLLQENFPKTIAYLIRKYRF